MATATIEHDGETEDFDLEQPYPVPGDDGFSGEDFKVADDLKEVAADVIAMHPDEFRHLDPSLVTIEYLWRRKSGNQNGREVRYQTLRTPPYVHLYNGSEFTVWIAAAPYRTTGVTYGTIEAIIFHSLCHIGFNEKKDECVIRDHEFSGFIAELDVFGPWERDLKLAGKKFRSINGDFEVTDPEPEAQSTLFDDDEEEGDK